MNLVKPLGTYTRVVQFFNSSGQPEALTAAPTITLYRNGVLSALTTPTLTAIGAITGGYLLSFTAVAGFGEYDRAQLYVVGTLATSAESVTVATPVITVLTQLIGTEIADHVLNRDMALARASTTPGTTSRSALNAISMLRNRVTRTFVAGAGTLTTYQEDDVTTAFSTVTVVTANAPTITASDPV